MTRRRTAGDRSSAPPAVLFVSYPAGLGGSARSLLTLLAGLDGRCERIVARRPGTTMARHLTDHALADGALDLAPRTAGRRGRVADMLRVARWARAQRSRLLAIHANGLSELQVAALAARAAGVPLVVWVHEPKIPMATRRLAPLVRAVAPEIDWVTVSEASRTAFLASAVNGSAAVRVVPNPIAPEDLGAPGAERRPGAGRRHDAVTVAYLGAPAPYKGFRLLPAVIESVAARRDGVRWTIWSGPRSAEPDVWRALERFPTVDLRDKTAAVADAYADADIVFCPSLEESFGRVAAEAMAFGRPVVASDLAALREVLGEAGVFFPPGDSEAAAGVLADLAADAARRARLAAIGRNRAAVFAPAAVTADFVRRYGLPADPGTGHATSRAVVVSHEATRTGAPVVAAQVTGALADAGRVDVVLRAPGPVEDEFGRQAHAVHHEGGRRSRVALRRAARRTGLGFLDRAANRWDERLAGRMLDRVPTDLVWCNTVLSAGYVGPARARGLPVVLHVHELGRLVPGALRRYGLLAGGGTRPLDGVTLVAASGEARDELAAALGVPATEIELLESTVDVAAIAPFRPAGAPLAPRISGAGDAAIVIGACGHATERKGPDLWLEIATRVHRERPGVRFVWVGRDGERLAETQLGRALGDAARFTGESAEPLVEMARFAVFTLPSRHDTFPLVVLEAMALGLPVVAFDAGGARRQVADTGVIVPPGDLEAFADAVIRLIDDPAERAALGAAARERVAAHFDVGGFGPAVRRIAERARSRAGTALPDA